jgi:LacI family transcriptional regulator
LHQRSQEQKPLADWLRALPKPVGLLACNDDRARQVIDACLMAGLNVPEEVAVVGVDNDEFVCHLSNPTISSVALGVEEAGYQAAQLLDRLMRGEKPHPQSIVPAMLRVEQSQGKRKVAWRAHIDVIARSAATKQSQFSAWEIASLRSQ